MGLRCRRALHQFGGPFRGEGLFTSSVRAALLYKGDAFPLAFSDEESSTSAEAPITESMRLAMTESSRVNTKAFLHEPNPHALQCNGVGCALADEGVTMSYKYRTVRVRGTELVGTIARKHGGAPEIYETSKDLSTSVVPVFFEATGEIRFFDRSVLEDVVAPANKTA